MCRPTRCSVATRSSDFLAITALKIAPPEDPGRVPQSYNMKSSLIEPIEGVLSSSWSVSTTVPVLVMRGRPSGCAVTMIGSFAHTLRTSEPDSRRIGSKPPAGVYMLQPTMVKSRRGLVKNSCSGRIDGLFVKILLINHLRLGVEFRNAHAIHMVYCTMYIKHALEHTVEF